MIDSCRDTLRSPTGNCWSFEDGMDGFVVHAVQCPYVGYSWLSGATCLNLETWCGRWPDWVKRETL